jgi:hypothetical protein
MKKIILVCSLLLIISCKSVKKDSVLPLYEILSESEYSGGKIKFYELVTEENEFRMILKDKSLKGKVVASDIKIANFVLLNLGEKETGGFSIKIESVTENDKNIVVKVVEIGPNKKDNVTMAITYPFMLLKINSKKEIIFE